MAEWTIRADFDPEASAWYVIDSDVPGLAADAETVEALERKIGPMLLDLVEIHRDVLTRDQVEGPHKVRMIAHHEHDFAIAA